MLRAVVFIVMVIAVTVCTGPYPVSPPAPDVRSVDADGCGETPEGCAKVRSRLRVPPAARTAKLPIARWADPTALRSTSPRDALRPRHARGTRLFDHRSAIRCVRGRSRCPPAADDVGTT